MQRRFSCFSDALSQVSPLPSSSFPGRRDSTQWRLQRQRRQSQQESEDSALLFLERRKSSDSNVGQIQPDLYRRKGSIISIGSSTSTSSCVGRVQLQLRYDFSKSDFIVQLVEVSIKLQLEDCQLCFSLVEAGDEDKTQDPNDLPFKDNSPGSTPTTPLKRRDSKKIMCGDFPEVNDEEKALRSHLRFPMSYSDLMERRLAVELVSSRPNGSGITKHAQRSISMKQLNPSSDDLLIWVDLESVTELDSYGELNLCLQYLPSAARLTLTIHQASNLPSSRADGLPNAYVRASLIQEPKVLLKKRKSNVRKGTTSPVWNEVLTFGVDQKLIHKCRLEVCVMDCDRFGNSRPIGQINFSSLPSGAEIKRRHSFTNSAHNVVFPHRLWREAIDGRQNPPYWIALECPEPSPPSSSISIPIHNSKGKISI